MKNAKGKVVAKSHLPQKTCLVCERPFSWRKKWEKDWEQVRYCSDVCRSHGINVKPSGGKS